MFIPKANQSYQFGFIVALTACLNACNPNYNIQWERKPSLLGAGNPTLTDGITLPNSAPVGSQINMTVYTVDSGCINQGDTEVQINGLVADVRPFDYFAVTGSLVGCPAYLGYFSHELTLSFTEVGPATVLVYGRSEYADVILPLERTIQIY